MTESDLANYLRQMMEELNYASERSFALYVGVSYSTVNRLLRGARIDPESLLQIASALHVPVENLYRLAGYLPLEEAQTRVIREVEHLMRELSEADQRRILDLIRVEHKHHRGQNRQAEQTDAPSSQKAG
jgi:transcriptional regulator with XRE-family HTH domain